MKISYTWLSGYFETGLPSAQELAELFNAHAFEVEGIEKVGNDEVLDVKVLPDRSHYALSHRGIAREAAAISGAKLKKEASRLIRIDPAVQAVRIDVGDKNLCPRYMARRMTGVKVADSPAWLKERLEAIDARSINTVVDATNFVMFDVGQPLHAFDADKVKGAIAVRRASPGEKIVVLDGREIELKGEDLVISDDEGPLAIAGVKGGKRAEVTAATTSIILESANFDPSSVRKTSTRANLRNDSSKRFENEITPALAEEALERVTALIQELSPGALAGAVADVYVRKAEPWTVEADCGYINSVTGLNLSPDEIADTLRKLQCEVSIKGSLISVTPPLDRFDLRIPEDLADEIGRMYGYDKLEAKQTPDLPPVPLDKSFYWAEKAKNTLVGLGFSETLLYTLVPKGAFEVAYPLASDKAALRERIASKLSESLVANARNADLLGLDAVKIFELGKVFPKTGEKLSLCMGVLQAKKKKGITSESVLKESLAALGAALGITFEQVKVETGPFGALVEIDFDSLAQSLGTPGSIVDLEFKPLSRDVKYHSFSQFPFIVRDIALFAPAATSEQDVAAALRSAVGEAAGSLLVKGPDLFDRFEKDGKVSYAFRMIFQSFDRTLSDDEANSFMAKAYEAVKGRGWEAR